MHADPAPAPRRRARQVATGLSSAGVATGRVVARGVRGMFEAGGPGFRDLGRAHAASTAGDTLVAIALAGTLFFSVPTSDARGKVLLYLLLTIAPFAVLAPVLGAVLNRNPRAYRHALVSGAAIRAGLAVGMAATLSSAWLYPLAFAMLVLSRVHGIARGALMPVAIEGPLALVEANARLARIGVAAGAAVVPFGLLGVAAAGSAGALWLSVGLFAIAATVGRRLPEPPTVVGTDSDGRRPRHGLPRPVRLAQLATAGVRLLNGFLLLLLAFAFRAEDAGPLDFGALLAAAGFGFALSSLTSPRLERRLREEPMVVAGLAIAAGSAFVTGQWFGLPAAAFLAAATGFAWGTAKFAFDGLLQDNVAASRRGLAFTRSETLFQLAWVVGAIIPTAVPMPTRLGLSLAGLAALAAQVVYVTALITPHERRTSGDVPDVSGLEQRP